MPSPLGVNTCPETVTIGRGDGVGVGTGGITESVSLAELFTGVESLVPGGVATVAVLVTLPANAVIVVAIRIS